MRFLPRAAFVAVLLAPVVAMAQVAPIAGDWYGTLAIPNGPKLALVFHIKPDGSATVDSPNQMAKGMPATATLADGKVAVTLSAIPASFEGAVSADGQSLQGQWLQGGGALPLTMSRTAPVLNRPQAPKPPFPYRAEEVSYRNPASGLKLAGTLTLPEGAGPFPAVVLITGSGAQDRDETMFGHKPFLVIADALTRKGVAVLRVDDRGTGGSEKGDASAASIPAFATDVAAGVAFLRGRPDIDPARVGLLGHSEGGQVAPLVAQNRALFAASGMPDDQVEILVKNRAERFAAVRDAKDADDARVRLTEVLNRQGLPPTSPERVATLTLASPAWRYFLSTNPADALAKVKVPVLAIGGSKDLQVDAKTNLAAIRAALAGDQDVTVKELPGLNHLFQTANTGLVIEYGQIEETIAPAALATIVDWTAAHAAKR
ncbi:alpha/beta hydrolase family protein [Caulobacter segnis]|uniref:alpha/beta hydrolase family protein n=1 Tax=Caulobacter segnis TaxID=88688 RepID=UPI001CBF035A|nr:alpha/beta fold hydrolase [Caulobacter segnis]UAL09849.1 alpha/beta fold hydrolase [Caulobacter segnis]